MVTPEIQPASSVTRKTMAAATSSGSPTRLIGKKDARAWYCSSFWRWRETRRVLISDGATALTRTP
jgi:hypothetical protein